MLKGLTLTPPVIGRISIGKVVERNGKRLPEKDDEFTLTSQVQSKGQWLPHPMDSKLRKPNEKLHSIPVKLLFDAPDLNLRAQYSLFDRQTGRPLCVGNGESCKRVQNGQLESLPCPSPEACSLGANNQCKPYGRLNVQISDDEELGSFIFRTTGFNSIRTLSARLHYFAAVSGNRLSTLPLELRLRAKSTTQSHRTPIYYVDLVVRNGMSLTEAIAEAVERYTLRQQSGFDQKALDNAARAGFAAGAFEENEEDGAVVMEEFYPDAIPQARHTISDGLAPTLAEKMAGKLESSVAP